MYWVGADAVGRALPRRAGRAGARRRPGVRRLRRHREHGHHASLVASALRGGRRGRSSSIPSPRSILASASSGSSCATTARCSSSTATVGFTGGINLAPPWLPPTEGGEGWRDDVDRGARRRGPGAADALLPDVARAHARAAARSTSAPLSRKHARPSGCSRASGERAGASTANTWSASPAREERIDIANSYFVPDRRVRAALFRAVHARRARPRARASKSDVPVVQFAVEALFDTLLRHGVEIWTLPAPMLHAKTAIIDDAFTTIGSYNLDERSWRKNLEVNLAVRGRGLRASRARRGSSATSTTATPHRPRPTWRASVDSRGAGSSGRRTP